MGPDAYFMGIIDFQQKWNIKKRVSSHIYIFVMCLLVYFNFFFIFPVVGM